jgi:hypothetical protein
MGIVLVAFRECQARLELVNLNFPQLPRVFYPGKFPPQSDGFRVSLIGSRDMFGKWGVEFIRGFIVG